MQSLKSPYILYNQQSVGSTLHNNLLFITYPTVKTTNIRNVVSAMAHPHKKFLPLFCFTLASAVFVTVFMLSPPYRLQ